MGSEGEFLQLHLSALAHDVAALEDALLAAGALSVTLGDQQDIAILEPGVGETPLWPEVRVSALFDADEDRARILETLEHTLGSTPDQNSYPAEICEPLRPVKRISSSEIVWLVAPSNT